MKVLFSIQKTAKLLLHTPVYFKSMPFISFTLYYDILSNIIVIWERLAPIEVKVFIGQSKANSAEI